MKANEIKRGMFIHDDGQNIKIKQVQVQSSSSRSGSTLYKVKGHNIVSRQKFEKNYKGDDVVMLIEVSYQNIQLLYRDNEACTFMDIESYEQFTLSEDVIKDELLYLKEGLEGVQALMLKGEILGVELPTSVELEIIECAPSMRSASSSARTKPATLSTGLIIQVPEYLEKGQSIKVNTETASYMSRV